PSCSYLPDRPSLMEYELALQLSAQEYEDRMNAGWRKFGMLLFHPVCAACQECRSVRILVNEFAPDRSQARAWKRNADLRVEHAPPTVDAARLDLYDRYHTSQATRKGWEADAIAAEEYAFRFLRTTVPAVEVSVWDEDALCAVALTDVTPNAVSGVY